MRTSGAVWRQWARFTVQRLILLELAKLTLLLTAHLSGLEAEAFAGSLEAMVHNLAHQF